MLRFISLNPLYLQYKVAEYRLNINCLTKENTRNQTETKKMKFHCLLLSTFVITDTGEHEFAFLVLKK